MKFIPASVSRAAGKAVLKTKTHSPAILLGAGIVGMVTTAVMASKATLQLEDVLAENAEIVYKAHETHAKHPEQYSKNDLDSDTLKLKIRLVGNIAKLYGPTALVGALSVAALTGSHKIMADRNTGLTAAYVAVDRAFKEYRKRVAEQAGEDVERSIYHDTKKQEVIVETEQGPQPREMTRVVGRGCSPYAKLFDETNPEWSRDRHYNSAKVSAVESYWNHKLRTRGHVFLNEVYRDLGFESTKAGAVVGWYYDLNDPNRDNVIDFGLDRTREGIAFKSGDVMGIWLDFNVDGMIYNLLEEF